MVIVTGYCLLWQSSGVSVGCLDDAPSGGAVKSFWGSVRGALDFDFGEDVEGWFTFYITFMLSACAELIQTTA
jgi:hypothetical protein